MGSPAGASFGFITRPPEGSRPGRKFGPMSRYSFHPEEALLEELDGKELVEITRQRLSTKDDIVTVDIDEI